MKKLSVEELENFELHHSIFAFVVIMTATILLTRLGVQFYNPNPNLFKFEWHHFDYGILLLLITNLFLLFGKKKYSIYLFMGAVSSGLILDDFWFIRNKMLDPGVEEISIYNTTLPVAILLVLLITIAIFLIRYFKEKQVK